MHFSSDFCHRSNCNNSAKPLTIFRLKINLLHKLKIKVLLPYTTIHTGPYIMQSIAYMTIKLNCRFIAEQIYKAALEKDFTNTKL